MSKLKASIRYEVHSRNPGERKWWKVCGHGGKLADARKCVADCKNGASSFLRSREYQIVEITTSRRVLP